MTRAALVLLALCLLATSSFGCEAAIITVARTAPGSDGGMPAPRPRLEGITFRSNIQSDLESQGCARCHAGGPTPMVIRVAPTTEEEWRSSYEEVSARAGATGTSLLLAKAAGGSGHVPILVAGDATYSRWQAWIADGAPFDDDDTPPPPIDGGAALADAGVPVDPSDEPVTWSADIDRLIDRNGCRRCHGDRGGYSLESLSGTMASGSDSTPNVLPGDPRSLLITYARDGHQGLAYRDALMILEWIVDYDARSE